ncbi:hypothetical protein [Ponticaulis sp.]|uniref:hypothetical protein n=1 Tax=Ponticaulis sp. TaxID=2020902 RepID=UPI000FF25B38|nr:hypothetical protein [Ponticaulis sp.]RPG17778.1 MAG: hypothetical protein CBC85_004330 [Hyphomonadaceae bacterium TMED125]
MSMRKVFTYTMSAVLLGLSGLSIWLLTDEVNTQHMRRADIADIEFSEMLPEHASADFLDALATRALESPDNLLDLSERATLLSIEKEPRRTSNWNRLAYIDVARHGELTDTGLNALRQSFYLSPYGEVEDMQWRLQFTNAYWSQLPDDLQTQSLDQITALAASSRREHRWLGTFAESANAEISDRINQSLEGIT